MNRIIKKIFEEIKETSKEYTDNINDWIETDDKQMIRKNINKTKRNIDTLSRMMRL
jgi:hypothetical protein